MIYIVSHFDFYTQCRVGLNADIDVVSISLLAIIHIIKQ